MCQSVVKTNNSTQLRNALGQYATGVAVVTTLNKSGKPVGITINSFSSASLEPALITWCIDLNSYHYQDFAECSSFVITVLAEHQQHIANRFSRSHQDRFGDLNTQDLNKPPTIPNGCAEFHCQHIDSIIVGDHLLLIGQVFQFESNKQTPLIFMQGRFVSNSTRSLASVQH